MSDELLKVIHQDVKELRVQTQELVKQGAIHNEILYQHERRSTQLEVRVDPLEKDLVFRTKLFTGIMGGGGLLSILAALIAIYKAVSTI